MNLLIKSEIKTNLILARQNLLERLENLFQNKAVEAHVFGSVARGDADAYSDIDIWFTFNDVDYGDVYKNRFKYYAEIGTIVHLCEAPQNAPIGGVHTALLIEENKNIVVVDIYLCPLSTTYTVDDGKKLFGVDLTKGSIGYNPKKIKVDENYRIDFFIGFIFNSIKNLARKEENPLEAVLYEYQNKFLDANTVITPLPNKEQTFETLELIIRNIDKVANDKQKKTLVTIRDFARKMLL